MYYLFFFYLRKTYFASLTHALTAILITFLSLQAENFDERLSLCTIGAYNSLLYFFVDCFVRPDWTKYAHHFFSGMACLLALHLPPEILVYTIESLGIFELSNPCWTSLRLRIEDSDEISLPRVCTKTIAGLSMIVTFFLSRFVIFPSYTYLYTYDLPEFPWRIFTLVVGPLMLLNMYWFYLLIKGALKALQPRI